MRLGRYELVSSKNVVGTLLSDDMFYGVIQKGALKKGASNGTSVFTALTHAVRCSLMSRIY